MENYKPRKTEFLEVLEIADWRVKLYTITRNDEFSSDDILQHAIANLPEWLKHKHDHDFPDYNIACLIVHEGKEGVFSLLNWWVGENMLQNHVFLTPFNDPKQFRCISDSGIAFCVWELEIIWHERNAWIKHVLQSPDKPDFQKYLQDIFSQAEGSSSHFGQDHSHM